MDIVCVLIFPVIGAFEEMPVGKEQENKMNKKLSEETERYVGSDRQKNNEICPNTLTAFHPFRPIPVVLQKFIAYRCLSILCDYVYSAITAIVERRRNKNVHKRSRELTIHSRPWR